MPEDYLKDSMTKTHGIRSGEPKRPESLIEIPSMVPEVPEVSLCFNQEKNQPRQSNRASTFDVAGSTVDHHHQKHHQNEMLHRNKYESYNTWKAKNAQALHDITGGLEKTELGSKRASSTKRSAGLVRKQNSGNEIYSSSIIAPKYPVNGSLELVNSSQQNDSSAEYSPRINTQPKAPTSNQPGDTYPVEHQHTGQPVHKHLFPQHHVRDSHRTKENFKKPSTTSSNLQNHYGCKDRIVENIPYTYQMSDKSNHNVNPVFCVPNYCNKQCSCENQNALVNSLSGNQFVNEKPKLTDESRAHMQFLDTAKLYSPLESGLISNHLSSLSHIINIQKEQISMLCQEMGSQKMIMSALLEEVKQIHAAVSPQTQINRDTTRTENKSCQCCSCEHKNDQKTSEDSMSGKVKHNGDTTSKQTPLSPNSVEKRSVGVMTTSLDKSVNTTVSCNEKDKLQGVTDKVHKAKKLDQKPKAFNSPSPNKNKQKNKKEHTRREEKRKPHSNDTQRRNNKKDESHESSQSETSFSLDEAAVVLRTEAEQGDISPEVSIHVNMPDYSASSAESDTSDSSDGKDEGQESGTEGESSDPQIGWTFYDRVVGQVNNMLKKTSNDPRQEYAHTRRKNAGNILYQCNEDYETENNWSKRVTFDGPPLEDSDNNGLHLPRYHRFRANQDYRMPGGPERVQDFLVCDYPNGGNNLSLVNGSTNVSFATYRYYQRHQLLPQPPPDKVFLDPSQMKKKYKTRKSEKTPPMSLKSHKRRSGGPPSKILDMSALKHQPKLF